METSPLHSIFKKTKRSNRLSRLQLVHDELCISLKILFLLCLFTFFDFLSSSADA